MKGRGKAGRGGPRQQRRLSATACALAIPTANTPPRTHAQARLGLPVLTSIAAFICLIVTYSSWGIARDMVLSRPWEPTAFTLRRTRSQDRRLQLSPGRGHLFHLARQDRVMMPERTAWSQIPLHFRFSKPCNCAPASSPSPPVIHVELAPHTPHAGSSHRLPPSHCLPHPKRELLVLR